MYIHMYVQYKHLLFINTSLLVQMCASGSGAHLHPGGGRDSELARQLPVTSQYLHQSTAETEGSVWMYYEGCCQRGGIL